MADANRHIDWDQWPVQVQVRGSTVIDMGDLLFFDQTDGLRNGGSSSANRTAYPFVKIGGTTKTLASNQLLAANNFLGIAMYDSDSGTTESIAVATGGLYRYPLKSPKTVYIGNVVMPTGSGTSLYSQKVAIWTSGTTYDLGMIMEAKTTALNVEFRLRPTVIAIGNPVVP